MIYEILKSNDLSDLINIVDNRNLNNGENMFIRMK